MSSGASLRVIRIRELPEENSHHFIGENNKHGDSVHKQNQKEDNLSVEDISDKLEYKINSDELFDLAKDFTKITQPIMDETDLAKACTNAFRTFTAEERKSLETEGYIELEERLMYGISLLFHDVIEMFLAIRGDAAAFKRLLPKIHMEIYDVEDMDKSSDDENVSAAEKEAESRYTIWFESCGSDELNPGSERERNNYKTELYGTKLSFHRRLSAWGKEYGCGRTVHQLCDANETPDDFQFLARKYLPIFLHELIDEGCNHNFKGFFAKAAAIDVKTPTILVNDFNSDLVTTLWHVMRLINEGVIPLDVSRCKCCGRLINTAKEAGHAREYCDSSCRSLHRKRIIAQQNTGKEYADAKIRREFFEYMESDQAVHIGMVSPMGPEIQYLGEPSKQRPGKAFIHKRFGYKNTQK